jgi:hypothetical protein
MIVKVAAVAVLVFLGAAVFAALTYPHDVVNFQILFSVGTATESKAFSLSTFGTAVQVLVAISGNDTRYTAKLLDSKDSILWIHSATEKQGTYYSGWLKLATGNYYFILTTTCINSFHAQIAVQAKGVFW